MKFLRRITALLFASTAAAMAADVKEATLKEAADMVKKGEVVVLDVRTADEFSDGHIKGAVNLDFNGKDFKKAAAKLDPSKTYLVHCQAGGRSARSLPVLKEAGLQNLVHMADGFGGWADAGLPTRK
jgi:phage shock protein E